MYHSLKNKLWIRYFKSLIAELKIKAWQEFEATRRALRFCSPFFKENQGLQNLYKHDTETKVERVAKQRICLPLLMWVENVYDLVSNDYNG